MRADIGCNGWIWINKDTPKLRIKPTFCFNMFQGFYRETPRAQQIDFMERVWTCLDIFRNPPFSMKLRIFGHQKWRRKGRKPSTMSGKRKAASWSSRSHSGLSSTFRLNDLLTYGTASNGLRFGRYDKIWQDMTRYWLVVWNIFYLYPYIGTRKNHPNWLLFFGGVETTSRIQHSESPDGWLQSEGDELRHGEWGRGAISISCSSKQDLWLVVAVATTAEI